MSEILISVELYNRLVKNLKSNMETFSRGIYYDRNGKKHIQKATAMYHENEECLEELLKNE